MKIAKGPRPWTVRLFALAFLIVALMGLYEGLLMRYFAMLRYQSWMPWIAWDFELTAIAAFSEFTIALIPIVWIYLFSARFARWFVFGFGLLKLWRHDFALISLFEGDPVALHFFVEPALILFALAMLLMPDTARWLARGKDSDVSDFE